MRKGSYKPVMVLQRLNNWSWASFPLYNFVSQVSEAKCRHSVNANIQHQTARSASPAGTGYHSRRLRTQKSIPRVSLSQDTIKQNYILISLPCLVLRNLQDQAINFPIGLLRQSYMKVYGYLKKKTITSILKPTYTNLFTEKIKIQIHLPPNLSAHKQGGIWKFPNLHAKKKYFNLWGFIHTPSGEYFSSSYILKLQWWSGSWPRLSLNGVQVVAVSQKVYKS